MIRLTAATLAALALVLTATGAQAHHRSSCEAIPPAYTNFIGTQLTRHIKQEAYA